MTIRAGFDPLNPLAHDDVARLFGAIEQWNEDRWRVAVGTARDLAHRHRRATSRLLCDAVLATSLNALSAWTVSDLARTAAAGAPTGAQSIAAEFIEDAAFALIARPQLALLDLAVLLQPCLPLSS